MAYNTRSASHSAELGGNTRATFICIDPYDNGDMQVENEEAQGEILTDESDQPAQEVLGRGSIFKFDNGIAVDATTLPALKKNDYLYAPEYVNPYYMRIWIHSQTKLYFQSPIWLRKNQPAEQAPFACSNWLYVSLNFVRTLAQDRVDWLALSTLKRIRFPDDYSADDEAFDGAKLQELSFEDLESPPRKGVEPIPSTYNKAKPKNTQPYLQLNGIAEEYFPLVDKKFTQGRAAYIPVRDKHGTLLMLHVCDEWPQEREKQISKLEKIKAMFAEQWWTSFKLEDGVPERVGGFRPRYSVSQLGFDLLVVPNLKNLSRAWQVPRKNASEDVKEMIKAINVSQKPDTMLHLQKPASFDSLIKIGDNPFGFYSTYITRENFAKYMIGLEKTKTDQEGSGVNAARSHPDLLVGLRTLQHGMEDMPCIPATDKTELNVELSLHKMATAVGKRSLGKQPLHIMGASANDIASNDLNWEHPKVLKENDEFDFRLSSGFYMAEWLHLCAFSWGGLEERNVLDQFHTSNHPHNLVLGTSETNSQMTRFEKAWQTLVRDEVTEAHNTTFAPKLQIIRNAENHPIPMDYKSHETVMYSRTSGEILTPQERELANLHKYLAYSIHYRITFEQESLILGLKAQTTLETVFYPFLRPLYHKMEALLDNAIYQTLLTQTRSSTETFLLPNDWNDLCKAELYSFLRNNQFPTENQSPYTTSNLGKGSPKTTTKKKGTIGDVNGVHPEDRGSSKKHHIEHLLQGQQGAVGNPSQSSQGNRRGIISW